MRGENGATLTDMGRARLTFLLALTILAATPAAAEDVPGYKPTYAIVRARTMA